MSLFILGLTVYITGFFFFVYVCLIADPQKSKLAHTVVEKLPHHVLSLIENIAGAKIKNALQRTFRYLIYERNPALIILYLVIVLGGWSIMITYGYPYIPSRYLAPYHRYSGYVLFVVCMASFRQAVRTPPGIITPRTMTKFDNYPYDALLYTDGRVCPTLHMKKLARSKYDRMTNRHVARFDHYCAWLDNTIGEENYRFFLFFVMVQWFMCWYGSSVIFWILKGDVDDKHLFEATFF
mmetsp:Transcript_52751/g.63502  ORF Transcript_52751/g.63502 Transcript_52751/m.63502 type:complete len:238 (-) Transcript_52751:12-725(-)